MPNYRMERWMGRQAENDDLIGLSVGRGFKKWFSNHHKKTLKIEDF